MPKGIILNANPAASVKLNENAAVESCRRRIEITLKTSPTPVPPEMPFFAPAARGARTGS